MPELRLRRAEASDHTPDQADDLFAQEVTQATHGFAVGDIIYRTGLAAWAKAQSDAEATVKMLGLVVHVEDANNFSVLTTPGWDYGEVHGLGGSFGDPVYVSASVAGAKTLTAPSSSGQFVAPIGWIIDANTWWWQPSSIIYPAEQWQ